MRYSIIDGLVESPDTYRSVTLFQKAGVPIFVSFGSFGEGLDRAPKARESRRRRRRGDGMRGGGFPSLPGEESGEGAKFFVTYSRKGEFWWIPDAF